MLRWHLELRHAGAHWGAGAQGHEQNLMEGESAQSNTPEPDHPEKAWATLEGMTTVAPKGTVPPVAGPWATVPGLVCSSVAPPLKIEGLTMVSLKTILYKPRGHKKRTNLGVLTSFENVVKHTPI